MKNPRIKNKFIAMLVAAILILSSASVGLAAINEDNIDSKDLEPQTPDLVGMLQDNYVFSQYSCYTIPIKINTVERKTWQKKGVFYEKLLERINKFTRFYYSGDKNLKHTIEIAKIEEKGENGYKQILKEQFANGYIVFPTKLTVEASVWKPGEPGGLDSESEGSKEGYLEKDYAEVHFNIILVYATDTSKKPPDGQQKNPDNGMIGPEFDGGGGGITPSPKKKTKKDKKKTTASISEKHKDADDDRAPEDIGNRTEKVEPKDVAAIALTAADGLALLLLAILVVPDLMVMRWFHRKKLAHKNDKGDIL